MSSVMSQADTTQPANESATLWQPGIHIPQLDGIRGLAILIVTLYRFSKEIPTDGWIGKTLHSAFAFGDRGVDLFFVLSGFLITGILLDAKGKDHYFRNFFARRSLRIFPLYFFALALFLLVFGSFSSGAEMFQSARENQLFLWTYLANVKMSLDAAWCFGSLDHFWSLAVEEHFYLVWPFVVFLFSRRFLLRLATLLAIAGAGGRMLYAMVSENGVAPDVLTIFRCDALLIGSAVALQIRAPAGLRPWLKYTWGVFGMCLLLGIVCGITGKRAFTISHTLWPLIWACVLIWLLVGTRTSGLAKLFDLRPLRKLGKFSYAMYVFQSPLIPITAGVISVATFSSWIGNEIAGNLAYIATMFGLTYGAALLSWNLLERHCLQLKKWFEPNAEKKSCAAISVNARNASAAS